MLEWGFPWALCALPLPYLVWRFFPPHTTEVEALRVPFFARLAELTQATPGKGAVVRVRSWVRLALLSTIWVAIVLAMAKPTVRSQPITITKAARDLLLAVDLSGSMDTTDLADETGQKTTRLAIVKSVVGDFVARRQGDRLGLLVFGSAPYLQVPFTLDTRLVTTMLQETQTRMAGESTALGDAIGLALRIFEGSTASNRVLILLTDGNDTGSIVLPVTAASIASEQGVTIHVVGVGDPRLAGEDRLNEDVLGKIAQVTGGRYFHANDRQQLARIYTELDELEPIQFESHSYTPTKNVYYYPLGVAALLMTAFSLFVSALSLPLLGPRRR